MYLYKENNLLSEIENGNNFEFVINDENEYSITDYKVLKNQENDIFVKVMKIRRNGKRSLYYLSESFLKFSELINLGKADILISIIRSLFINVLYVRNNGFLMTEKIDIDFDKIFIDRDNLTVKLVYLPLNSKQFDSPFEMENELRIRLIKFLSDSNMKSDIKIQELIDILSDGTNKLEDIIKKSGGKKNLFVSESPVMNFAADKSLPKLMIYTGPLGKMEIPFDKNLITIGKKHDLCNAVIQNNSAISRKHASVIREGNQFFIKDEGSSNGTFINGVRLTPGQKMPFSIGDTIRLSDMDFVVY